MLEPNEIVEKDLKDGRDYIYIGGQRYRPGDCLLFHNGQEMTVNVILDPTHFFDQRNFCMHSFMYYDQKWQHCPERNANKKTKDRSQYAVIADRLRIEREAFKSKMIENKPYQIYEDYQRIYFTEKMSWHLINRERDPDCEESAALLKLSDNLAGQGKTLVSEMYWHNALKDKRMDLGSKTDFERFVTSYVKAQDNQQY